MELNKKKYKKEEVSELLENNSFEYENKIADLKDRINELIENNKDLVEKVEYYKNKEGVIIDTLEQVNNESKEKKEEIELSYQAEIDSLKNFSSKWDEYFSLLKEKYPLYPVIQDAIELKEKLKQLLNTDDKAKIVSSLKEKLDLNQKDNPQARINGYIAKTTGEEFDIEEVLHPGELKLEDLCKELGLMENKK